MDRYAVLDRNGRFLGGFPSGADGSEVEANDAWYPAKDVAGLVGCAGMVFGQDQVDTPREVIDRYPGLLDHPRLDVSAMYASTVVVPAGLFMIVFPLLNPPPGDDLIFWFGRFFAFVGGVLFVWLGVRDFPPILRRRRQRMKARHPERFAPRNHL
jgi:membrane associated rhomboid family serine protease